MKEEIHYNDISIYSRNMSTVESRHDISLKRTIKFGNSELELIPVISSPMADVSGFDLCQLLQNHGALGVLHRFQSEKKWADSVHNLLHYACDNQIVSVAISLSDYKQKLSLLDPERLINKNLLICIDTANGHSVHVQRIMNELIRLKDSLKYTNIEFMCGNVVTRQGASFLYDLGIRFIRVGIGGGSVCATPIETGIYRPILGALQEIRMWKEFHAREDLYIIADGGFKRGGDFMKAFALGADFVMSGSMFAGWEGVSENASQYRGSASRSVANYVKEMQGNGNFRIAEGVETEIDKTKGGIKEFNQFMRQIYGGMKSAMSYADCYYIAEFSQNVEIVIGSQHAMQSAGITFNSNYKTL